MPKIVELAWDSSVLGGRAGRIDDLTQPIDMRDLVGFDVVHARVPQSDLAIIWRLEALGFRFVTLDYGMKKLPTPNAPVQRDFRLVRLSREESAFPIEGFQVQGSRFHLDPRLRARIPPGFWDAMIRNHCREFADFVVAAVSKEGALIGCVTCFETPTAIDMFLVAVHPDHQGRGIGRDLLLGVEAEAVARGKVLTTSVVSHNLGAMNFYLRNGFIYSDAYTVLHMVSDGETRSSHVRHL